MKSITLRDIPDAVAESIIRQAESSGSSLNKTVIDILTNATCPPRRQREYHDLDDLIGRWSDDEASEKVSLWRLWFITNSGIILEWTTCRRCPTSLLNGSAMRSTS